MQLAAMIFTFALTQTPPITEVEQESLASGEIPDPCPNEGQQCNDPCCPSSLGEVFCINRKPKCLCNGAITCTASGVPCDDGNPLTYGDHCDASLNCVGGGNVPFKARILNGTTKLKRDEDFVAGGPTSKAVIRAAKNEFEAVQVAIRPLPETSSVPNVTVSVKRSPLQCGVGAYVPFSVYREEYIYAANRSGPDGEIGWWPDRLIPAFDEINGVAYSDRDGTVAFPANISPGTNLVAYVEAYVPPSCSGALERERCDWIRVSWGSNPSVTYTEFKMDMQYLGGITLPSTSSLPTYYEMSSEQICRAHGKPDGCTTTSTINGVSKHIPLSTLYSQYVLDHRIAADPVLTFPEQSPLASFVSMYGDYFNGQTPSWARLMGAVPATTGAFRRKGAEKNEASEALYRDMWVDAHVDDADVFKSDPHRNWLARTFDYTCDEPQDDRLPPVGKGECDDDPATSIPACPSKCPYGFNGIPRIAMNDDRAGLRLGVTTSDLVASAPENLGTTGYSQYIDTIIPNIIHIQQRDTNEFPTDELAKYATYLNASTLKLWWYQANDTAAYGNANDGRYTGYPQYGIDLSGTKNRAMQWLTFAMAPTLDGPGINGELYWDMVAAFGYADDFGRIPTDRLGWEAYGQYGDGTLLYPGKDRPIPSLRLKIIRDGMEDFEYLMLAARAGCSPLNPACGLWCARTIARTLFPHARSIVSHVGAEAEVRIAYDEQLLASREKLIQRIYNPASCPP